MGKKLFPDSLGKENASAHPGATRIYLGYLITTRLNLALRHDEDWGDQADVTTGMLQNDLDVPMTRKLDAATRAAVLTRDGVDFDGYVVEEFLPATMLPADATHA